MDCSPLFRDYLDAPGQLVPTKQETSTKQNIQVTWIAPSSELNPKMALYVEHIMELKDGLIV